MAETLLDARGLNCPLPVLRARKALRQVAPGDSLRVLATDPSAVRDFEAFCEAAGLELEQSSREAELFVFVIRKPD